MNATAMKNVSEFLRILIKKTSNLINTTIVFTQMLVTIEFRIENR